MSERSWLLGVYLLAHLCLDMDREGTATNGESVVAGMGDRQLPLEAWPLVSTVSNVQTVP